MTYTVKNYEHLIGLPGLSEKLLRNHFTLYGGYVTNVNKLNSTLPTLTANTPEWNELTRRYGWEYNGMKLHELYFENLTKEASTPSGKLESAITTRYGSVEKFMAEFRVLGLTRGIGWAALVQDAETQELSTIWIGEHDLGLLANQAILLVMDVWEHAYMTDYEIKRADYVTACMQIIDWKVVESRMA